MKGGGGPLSENRPVCSVSVAFPSALITVVVIVLLGGLVVLHLPFRHKRERPPSDVTPPKKSEMCSLKKYILWVIKVKV